MIWCGKVQDGTIKEKEEKIEFINKYNSLYKTKTLLFLTNISSSAYYRNKNKQFYDTTLLNIIKTIHNNFPYYGYRRITNLLRRYFYATLSYKKVLKYMRKLNIKAVIYRKNKWRYPLQPNLIQKENLTKDLIITKSNQLWNIDITYIKVNNHKMSYLYVIRDAYNGRIVNYNYSKQFNYKLVMDTTEDAINLNDTSELIIHSDHGAQFTSFEFKELLNVYNIKHSISRNGMPQDNQKIEQLMAQIKREIIPRRKREIKSFEEMKEIINKWVYQYNYVHQLNNKKTRCEYLVNCESLFLSSH